MTQSEMLGLSGDEEIIKELCVCNGVSFEKISQEGSGVTALEMFFSGFPRMVGLSLFPRLTRLTLVGQSITQIQGLENCPSLRELWVVECQIEEISGLEKCLQLLKLFLYDNNISKISSLELLTNLQVLWLNNNIISEIEGLSMLGNLRELNLADNLIESIGNSLDQNTNLQKLNLSGNKISSFKELTHLTRLSKLRELGLKDPQSRPNPVCMLCNYFTHILYHVPTLQRLDSYDVTSKAIKESAESTVTKKMMYYNMRLHSAQRQFDNTEAKLQQQKKKQMQRPEERIRTLSYTLKHVSIIINIQVKLNKIVILQMIVCVCVCVCVFCRVEACFRRNITQALDRKELMVQFLVMELETVGNIRFEEGNTSDAWFSSCYDLLLSRFCALDHKPHNITGIKINRIIRVHNRVLRLRFEDKLHSMNYKRFLDYLFYAPDPERSSEGSEVLCILENGFKSAESYKVIVNIVKAVIWLLQIIPVLMLYTVIHHINCTVNFILQTSAVFAFCQYPIECVCVYFSDAACSSDLQGSCDCSQKQTMWFVFDHELVLPEYLIDFDFIRQPGDASPLLCDNEALDREALALEPILEPRPKLLSLDEKSILTAAQANVLSQITVLNLHDSGLTKLKEISCLTALRHLTISFNEFTHLDDISHLPSLECVDASFNQIVTLGGLRGLGRLTQLDLRWNQLTHARDDMAVLQKHAPSLLRLDTRQNPWTTQKTAKMMVVLGRLRTLTHFDGVLVTEEEAADAEQMATASLVAHSRVDSDRPRCLSLLTTAQLLTHLWPSPWTHTITALNLDGQRLARIANLDKLVNLRWASFNNNELSHIEGLEHCPLLEELSLNHNNISSLDGVCKLQRLTRLSVNSNQLQCLDGSVLDHLPNLHFLSAERNLIPSLHGVQRSRSLFELYVGNNNISVISFLKVLTSLIILDLYGNPLVEKLESYRIYVVFHLPSLKALDGTAVEVTECENAKDVFGGRLTPDMVTEKLGISNYREMTELELTACSIRMVDLVPADLFVNLRCVNLERNNLTSFSGLIYLPNITALCLNYNHIESVLPRQKTQTHHSLRQPPYHKVSSSGYGQHNSKNSRDALCGESLEPLMASLEVLHLGYNGISNLSELQLSRLTNLKSLFLQGNEMVQVEGLEGLRRLQELVLDRNRLRCVSANSFSAQAALLELHMSDNRLRDLSHLHTLSQLRSLHLDNNKVQDLSELEKLDALPSLIKLSVLGNPVARRCLHRPVVVLRLPGLQVLDGISITLDERTRAELTYAEGQVHIYIYMYRERKLYHISIYKAARNQGSKLQADNTHL
uniref:Leucine-rich repeat-containing protein 9-like n=1 Tax=Astyanax mexicanus TaxID=7994 RepID=A0A8B9JSA5_ASTMX